VQCAVGHDAQEQVGQTRFAGWGIHHLHLVQGDCHPGGDAKLPHKRRKSLVPGGPARDDSPMVTTLDMPETPCLAPPVPAEVERTTISPMKYEGFWASSGTVEIVVAVDRIAANPINRRDSSGLKIIRYVDFLSSTDKQVVADADAFVSRVIKNRITEFNELTDKAFADAFFKGVVPAAGDPGTLLYVIFREIRNVFLRELQEMADMLDVTGMIAYTRCNADRVGIHSVKNLLAFSYPGKNEIYFLDKFFNSDVATQRITFLHELSHAAAFTHDRQKFPLDSVTDYRIVTYYIDWAKSAYTVERLVGLPARALTFGEFNAHFRPRRR
jgi:hypothetical protein